MMADDEPLSPQEWDEAEEEAGLTAGQLFAHLSEMLGPPQVDNDECWAWTLGNEPDHAAAHPVVLVSDGYIVLTHDGNPEHAALFQKIEDWLDELAAPCTINPLTPEGEVQESPDVTGDDLY